MKRLNRNRAVLFVVWLILGTVGLSALMTEPRAIERDKIAARLNSSEISIAAKLTALKWVSREDRVQILSKVDPVTKSALWRAHHQRWIESNVLTPEQVEAVRQADLIVTPEYYTVHDDTHKGTVTKSCRSLTAALGADLKIKVAVDIGFEPGQDSRPSTLLALLTNARTTLSNLLATPLRADPPVCTCNLDSGTCCDKLCRCEGPLSTCSNYLQFGCGCNGMSLCTGYCGCCGCPPGGGVNRP